MKKTILVIENHDEDGCEWGLSFSDHNPEPEYYFKMSDKETAFRLQKHLTESPTSPVWPGEDEIDIFTVKIVKGKEMSATNVHLVKDIIEDVIQWLKQRAGGGEEPEQEEYQVQYENGEWSREIRMRDKSPSTSGGEKEEVKPSIISTMTARGWVHAYTDELPYKESLEKFIRDNPQPPTSGKPDPSKWHSVEYYMNKVEEYSNRFQSQAKLIVEQEAEIAKLKSGEQFGREDMKEAAKHASFTFYEDRNIHVFEEEKFNAWLTNYLIEVKQKK